MCIEHFCPQAVLSAYKYVNISTCMQFLKQVPQIFEYSFVLQYSNTINAIQLFVCNHVGLRVYIFSTTWSWDAHIIGGTYLVTRT